MKALLLTALLLLTFGCETAERSPCDRYFQPYPDMVSGSEMNHRNENYVKAMQHYSKGEFEAAIPLLDAYIDRYGSAPAPKLYKVVCLLAIGQPYEAELQLDHLERSANNNFKDQVDWYNVMCMLCSDQLDRALEQAKQIAERKRHTYKKQAQQVIADLQQ